MWELPTSFDAGQIEQLAPGVWSGFDGVSLVDLPMGAAFAPLHKVLWRYRMRRRGKKIGRSKLARAAASEMVRSGVRLLTEKRLRNNLDRLAMLPEDTERVLHLSAQMRGRREIRRRAREAAVRGVNEFMVMSGGGVFQQIDRLWKRHPLTGWTHARAWKPIHRLAGRVDSAGVLKELGRMLVDGELPPDCRVSFVVNPNHPHPEMELDKLRAKAEAVRAFNPDFTGVRLYAQPTLYAFDAADPEMSGGVSTWEVNASADAAYRAFYEKVYGGILPTSVELIIGMPAFGSDYQVDFWSYLVGRSDARAQALFDAYHRVYDPNNKADFLNMRARWIEAAVEHGRDLALSLALESYGFIFQPATRTLTTKPFQSALDHLDRLEESQPSL
ncbi:MAG: hypothetical protein AAGB29_05670 [Planctomycetota bacterium]